MKKLIIRTAALAMVGCVAFGCVSRPVTYVASSIPLEQGKYGCSAKSGTGIAVCGMELLRETA